MSGTSMDGLDCGLFHITLSHDYQLEWQCHGFKTFIYSEEIRNMINKSLAGETNSIEYINEQLGQLFVSYIKQFLNNRNIDMIASHGQTIAHEDGILTTQIGNPYYMYKEYDVPIIYNFRQADIDAGGNGAPLMPFLDWLLFKESRKNTITLNLGGVANISYIPSSGKREEVMGFDTGPGMALMDETCREVWGIDMDKGGLKTAKGDVNAELLINLMKNQYITKKPPKSTGRDEFGSDMVKHIIKEHPHIIAEDLLRTFCAFTAKAISVNIKNILNINNLNPRLIISGGGVHHPVLMEDIRKYVQISNIKIADDYNIESKMKESLLMAVMAVARMQNLPSNMPSASGANKQTILGEIFHA
jgi:anhydro-N-acetylmuramic acid kinase